MATISTTLTDTNSNTRGQMSSILNSLVARNIIDNNDDLLKGRTRNCCIDIENDQLHSSSSTHNQKHAKQNRVNTTITINNITQTTNKTRLKQPKQQQQQQRKVHHSRSRSLPSYFDIESLLKFLSSSIKLNKPAPVPQTLLQPPAIITALPTQTDNLNINNNNNKKKPVNNSYLSCNLPLTSFDHSNYNRTNNDPPLLPPPPQPTTEIVETTTVNLLKKIQTQPELNVSSPYIIEKSNNPEPLFNDLTDIKYQQHHNLIGTTTSAYLNTTRIDIRRARSFRDLSQIKQQQVYRLNDLIINEKIGEGFFAVCTKITHRYTGQVMVLKELKLDLYEQQLQLNAGNNIDDFNENNQAFKSFLKEAQVLRSLKHPNIIKFLGVLFTKDRRLNLILEYVSGGTLKDIIHNLNISLSWKLRVGYAKDIAAGMEYLHSLNIIHRDLKSDNCLVRENGTVVVADFGLSRVVEDETLFNISAYESSSSTQQTTATTQLLTQNTATTTTTSNCVGTSLIAAAKRKLKRRIDRKQRYAVVGNSFSMAPEMLKHQVYDERVDIFSFGIICCEVS